MQFEPKIHWSRNFMYILSVFDEIIVYLCKMIVNLKKISEKFMFQQLVIKIGNFVDIRQKNNVFAPKQKEKTKAC